MILEFKLDKKTHMKINLLMILHKWPFYASMGLFLVFLVVSIAAKFNLLYSFIFFILILLSYVALILNNSLSSNNSKFFLPRKYSFGDEGVSVIFPNSERKVKWSAFVSWKRIAVYYILNLSGSGAIVIPESAIPIGEVATFEGMLNQNIKSKKKVKSK
jgi:hypothetical protein